jgi:hypothetical protein
MNALSFTSTPDIRLTDLVFMTRDNLPFTTSCFWFRCGLWMLVKYNSGDRVRTRQSSRTLLNHKRDSAADSRWQWFLRYLTTPFQL